jgi:luciferase-like monooxygenase
MGIILERISRELLSWADVTSEPHRFGGTEFRIYKRELGHMLAAEMTDEDEDSEEPA